MSSYLYKQLEVEKTSTQEEIKKSYRKLSLKYHPDRNQGNEEFTKKFQEISSAYEILGDTEKRQQYDLKENHRNSHFNANNANINPEELFKFFTSSNNVFKAGPNGPTSHKHVFNFNTALNKPVPIVKNIEITLVESYNGCTKPLMVTRWVIENNIRRQENEKLYVIIPRGVDDNEMIIVRGKGNSQSYTNQGDIKIFIKIINKTEFTRNGLDLIYNKQITLKEALCGFAFNMKYINDKIYKINNDNGNVISPNYKKMIPNMGMIRGEHNGNLIIEFVISFPEHLNKEKILELSKIL